MSGKADDAARDWTYVRGTLLAIALVFVVQVWGAYKGWWRSRTIVSPDEDFISKPSLLESPHGVMCPIFILSPLTDDNLAQIESFITSHKETCSPVVFAQFDTLRCNEPNSWTEYCETICSANPASCNNLLPNQFNQYSSDLDSWFSHQPQNARTLTFERLLEEHDVPTYVYPTQLGKNPIADGFYTAMHQARSGPPADVSLSRAFYDHWCESKGGAAQPFFDTVVITDFLMSIFESESFLTSVPVGRERREAALGPVILEDCRQNPRSHSVCDLKEIVIRRIPRAKGRVFARLPPKHRMGHWFKELTRRHVCLLMHLFEIDELQLPAPRESINRRECSVQQAERPKHIGDLLVVQDGPDADNIVSVELLRRAIKLSPTRDSLLATGRPTNFLSKLPPNTECSFQNLLFGKSPSATGELTWPAIRPGDCERTERFWRGKKLDTDIELDALVTLFQGVTNGDLSVQPGGANFGIPLNEIIHPPQVARLATELADPHKQHIFCDRAWQKGLSKAQDWCIKQNARRN
eukprot:c32691_g1_i1.p1 GENE.c32691_g1_i1~~c32691_g1_i1.p1  ORF type:complete len:524 (-),score=64.60 c32691_g1_i1:283-1854(-)